MREVKYSKVVDRLQIYCIMAFAWKQQLAQNIDNQRFIIGRFYTRDA